MRISPLGIDAEQFRAIAYNAEIDAFRVRYGLRRAIYWKWHESNPRNAQVELIEALYDVPVPLVFVGRPLPYEPNYADRARELARSRGNVTFLERLPDEDLPLVYAAAAAHILPSWIELPGLSSLEAGASGTRVIASRDSSVVEILGDEAWYLRSIRYRFVGPYREGSAALSRSA